jgi:hypothetical protein
LDFWFENIPSGSTDSNPKFVYQYDQHNFQRSRKNSAVLMFFTHLFMSYLVACAGGKLGVDSLPFFLFYVTPEAGLPDFSWYNIPKRGEIYQINKMSIKYNKRP